MNYLDWSNEYFETAEKMASLIRLLNEERKHARPVQKKQIDKELNRVAVEFENRCANGLMSNNPRLTFAGFVPQYLELINQLVLILLVYLLFCPYQK